MDRDGWHKSMAISPYMYYSYPFNTQVLLHDGHDSHFDDRVINILRSHNIQSFILNEGYSVHEQPNYNGPNFKLNNLYGGARMK